jgi:hypothetical protein
MIPSSIIRILLILAAAGHFVTLPARALAPRFGILPRPDFRALTPINERIVLVVLAAIQCVLIGSGVTVLWSLEEILAGGRLARSVTLSLALLFLGRVLAQAFLYGPVLPLRADPRVRLLHACLIAHFSFMTAAYFVAFAHALLRSVGG